jgi:hypothetical protein
LSFDPGSSEYCLARAAKSSPALALARISSIFLRQQEDVTNGGRLVLCVGLGDILGRDGDLLGKRGFEEGVDEDLLAEALLDMFDVELARLQGVEEPLFPAGPFVLGLEGFLQFPGRSGGFGLHGLVEQELLLGELDGAVLDDRF